MAKEFCRAAASCRIQLRHPEQLQSISQSTRMQTAVQQRSMCGGERVSMHQRYLPYLQRLLHRVCGRTERHLH